MISVHSYKIAVVDLTTPNACIMIRPQRSQPRQADRPERKTTMTNKEAYLEDLDYLQNEIYRLLSLVPLGKSKREIQMREQAEEAASKARATISCMRNDYIPLEL